MHQILSGTPIATANVKAVIACASKLARRRWGIARVVCGNNNSEKKHVAFGVAG